MALELKLNVRMEHKLIMTPMLQQSIKLLPLARLEFLQKIKQEVIENPMLEEVVSEENLDEDPEEGFVGSKSEEVPEPKDKKDENPEIDWESFVQNNVDRGLSPGGLTERPSIESTLKNEISLGAHLSSQLMISSADENEKAIGEEIIGNINYSGYLECSTDEIAELLKVNIVTVENVLNLIQTFEPIGIGARNLQECLLIQAKTLSPDYKLVEILLQNHINKLEDRFFLKMSKDLNVLISEITDAVKFIRKLNPKPASAFSDERTQYIIPDVTVVKKDDEYQVFLNDAGTPLLRVNPVYMRILSSGKSSNSAKEFMKEKYNAALWFIKGIEQRRQTILKVATSIVKFQKDFFDKGLSHLKPLVLRDIAEDIEMHESTVSRITTKKYMHTPSGIIDFKFFFHSGLESGGIATSSVRIKDMIEELIKNEDPICPLSDKALVEALEKENIRIARRTVSKYRKILKISAANKRKRRYE